jgi:hypothetical protein
MSEIYDKIYFLCNKDKEPDRYNFLIKQIDNLNLQNYEFFNYIWGTDITDTIRKKYCKSDYTMHLHGRSMITNPLSNGEISLFLNYIECLRKIRKEYINGIFIIMESDVIFYDDFNKNLMKLLNSIKLLNTEWDIINIGNTKSWFKIDQCYKNTPIIINNIKFYKEKINRCAEAIIWNYQSVCKFLDYFDEKTDIDGPIDTKIDVLSDFLGRFNIYWNEPTFITQGSICNIFKTSLR